MRIFDTKTVGKSSPFPSDLTNKLQKPFLVTLTLKRSPPDRQGESSATHHRTQTACQLLLRPNRRMADTFHWTTIHTRLRCSGAALASMRPQLPPAMRCGDSHLQPPAPLSTGARIGRSGSMGNGSLDDRQTVTAAGRGVNVAVRHSVAAGVAFVPCSIARGNSFGLALPNRRLNVIGMQGSPDLRVSDRVTRRRDGPSASLRACSRSMPHPPGPSACCHHAMLDQ